MGLKEELCKNRAYWEKLLGTEICKEIADSEEIDFIPKNMGTAYEAEFQKVKAIFYENLGREENVCLEPKGIFSRFYWHFGKVAVAYAGEKQFDILENKEKNITDSLYKKIEWIPLRVLIHDIHRCKEAGLLQGGSSEKEYEDYCRRYLGDPQYIRDMCDRYPEMTDQILLQVLNHVLFLEEVVEAANNDRKTLIDYFFSNQRFRKIEQIDCGKSDAHRQGRTVAVVYFDNGERIVYKPRGLGKEIYFETLYEEFCTAAALEYEKVSVLDRRMYGWQTYVSGKNCEDKESVERYFTRMGIMLFLCYCLGATDIHGENILADGEYPRLIDLETIPGVQKPGKISNAEDLVREKLKRSVLSIGILPVPMWNSGGQGVIINALHGKQKVTTPFKVPEVCLPKSSDIYIGYREGTVDLNGSLPIYKESEINPADYSEEICRGFQCAYFYMLKNKSALSERFGVFFSYESRYLVRHTQQYAMLLRASLYPEFLKNEDRRRLFLHSLDGRGTKDMVPFLKYEQEALYQMDIPIFYVKGQGTSLYDGNGKEYPNMLEKTAMEQWQERVEQMDETDLKRQHRLVKLSLSSLAEYEREGERHQISDRKISIGDVEKFKAKFIKQIADKICDLAVIYEDKDIGFSGLHILPEGHQSITPMGMYLYDGIAGVAVFMAKAMKLHFSEKYVRIWGLLVAKMFRYTEGLERNEKAESKHIGAFTGEGSMVLAYLVLHEVTADNLFLEYARRHAAIVMSMSGEETSMDLLSGCAGAIAVFVKLYKATGEDIYRECAQQLEKILWTNMQKQEIGLGWSMAGDKKALGGLAHGNSGFLLAYAYLMEVAPKECYVERIKELLQYEDSLYDESLGNWKDLRHVNGERTSSNAWCHGGSGILLARLKLKELQEFANDEQIEKDITRCGEILLKGRNAREICLCHGMAGDYLVLVRLLECQNDTAVERACKDTWLKLIEKINKEKEILAKESENLSLMAGMSGVGLALCGDKALNFLILQ